LEEETGGWPAALRLAGISMAGVKARQRAAAGRSVPHRKEIYQYLATEVLNNLAEPLRQFILATSVLDILTPEICNLLLGGNDATQILESLDTQNLLSTYLEGEEEVYRYHHLFRKFLQSRLGERRNELVQKAGQCYLQFGYSARAVECFLTAGDYSQALLAIERVGARMLLHSRWQTVRRWLQSIPDPLKRERPWILLFEGVICINNGRLDKAEAFITEAASSFIESKDQDGAFQAHLYRARILRSRGDYEESAQLLEQILPELSLRPIAEWYDMAMEQSLSLSLRGELDKAERLLNQALNIAEREGEVTIAAQLAERLGELYFVKGDYSKAVTVHQRATEMASEQDRLSFLLRDSIATIYHDWGDLEQALEYAQNSIKAKEHLGLTEALPYAYQQLAFILGSLGEYAAAEEKYQHSIALAIELGGETFFLARSKVLYGRFLGTQDRLEEARALVDEALLIAKAQSEFIYALCQQATAPVYIRMGELQEGTRMLEQALDVLERIGAKYSVCVTCAVLALVYRQSNNQIAAERMSERCLQLAAPENCLQFFLANPEMMHPVMKLGLVKGVELDFISEIIRRQGSVAMELLLELVNHTDPLVRQRIIQPLTLVGGEDASLAVRKLLNDADESVRDYALAATRTFTVPDKPEMRQEKEADHVNRFAKNTPLTVQCLGPFNVLSAEKDVVWRTTKARDLFAYLIHHRDKPIQKERILDELWPDADPEQSSTLFHTNLYQLRKAVKTTDGRQPVRHKGGQYRLDPEMLTNDIENFESLVRILDQGDITELEKAVSLYRGEYMEGLDYEWVIAERERLSQLYLSVLDHLAHRYAEKGEYAKAATYLRAILRTNPLLEEAHALLMTVHARMGDRLAVLQQYETLSQVLEQKLGIDPSPKTRELYYKLCSDEE
jgi:DNA-binding SARP family transcriptional activator